MENALVVRYLVPVDGYRYEDITDVELKILSARFEEALSEGLLEAASFHGVIADDPEENTAVAVTEQMETGFLMLYQLAYPCCSAGAEAEVIESIFGPASAIDQLEIAEVPVFVYEDPGSVDSRYVYLWIDHGTAVYFDGADREPMERWLTRYLPLPKLAEHETPELAAQLTVIPGFGYANFEAPEESAALDGVPHVVHALVDSDGLIGMLVLTQTDDATPLEQFLQGFEPGATLEKTEESEIGGYPVATLRASSVSAPALMWAKDGITGAVVVSGTDTLASVEGFLGKFLAS